MPRETVVLHCCCGPCATLCAQRLAESDRPLLFFYNPNISPLEEYERRLQAMRQFATHSGWELVEGPRDFAAWEAVMRGRETEPEGGSRCDLCFRYRLEQTARFAGQRGLARFTTSLTVSPHKASARVFAAGQAAAEVAGVSFATMDFKKKDGFRESVRLANELGLYRQRDCGCRYSRRD